MWSPSRLLLARTALFSAPFIVQISRVIARSRFSPVQTRTVVLTSRARAEMSMLDLQGLELWGCGKAGFSLALVSSRNTLRKPRRPGGGKGADRQGGGSACATHPC